MVCIGKCEQFTPVHSLGSKHFYKVVFRIEHCGLVDWKPEIKHSGYRILQFIGDTGVLESWTEVENLGQGPVGLTYVSSFCLNGLTKDSALPWDETARLYVPSNSWYGEFQWNRYSLPCLGMSKVFDYSTKRISVSSTGT